MKLRFEDLQHHLSRGLGPSYLISGDEPLQLREAADQVRQFSREQGFTERHLLHVDKGFDWDQLWVLANSLSLFADKQLIELRMPGGKPGDQGAKALLRYAENPPVDTVLLVITDKLDGATQRAKWFLALEKLGFYLPVWPIDQQQLPAWIRQRMQSRGLRPTPAAVSVLADRVEGNLLAASQEIDKLLLLRGEGAVDEPAVLESVTDSARFDIYGLVDAALAGDVPRVNRMLEGLRLEGVESVLVLWALTRELLTLYGFARQVEAGTRIDQVIAQAKVWPKRKNLVSAALKRHPLKAWRQLLVKAGHIDRIIKGMQTGNLWDELLQLTLLLAGVRLLPG
jgi:DNA polymerase-3 subunit delta